MLWKAFHFRSLGSSRASVLLAGLQGRALETDERIRTKDQLPPALNRGVVRDTIIGPAEFILALFEAIFDPRAEPIGVADRLGDLAHKTWS